MTCEHGTWTWRLAACNEDGWHCIDCGAKAPGEPPGYRPDLDRSEVGAKVEAILMEITHAVELVHVSNSSDGDSIVAAVARRCRKLGHYDQCTIVAEIVATMNPGHAEFWAGRGEGVLSGKDKRDRCACGKLATSWGGDGHRCGDCAWDAGFGLLAASPRDETEAR